MDPLRSGAIFKLFPSGSKRAQLPPPDGFPLPPPPRTTSSAMLSASSSSATPAKAETTNLLRSRFEDLYRATPLPPMLASVLAGSDSRKAQEMAVRPEEAEAPPASLHRPYSSTPIHHDLVPPPPSAPTQSPPIQHRTPHPSDHASAAKQPSSLASTVRSEREKATPAGQNSLLRTAPTEELRSSPPPHQPVPYEASAIDMSPTATSAATAGDGAQASGRKGKRLRSGADSLVLLLSSYSVPTATTAESTDDLDTHSVPPVSKSTPNAQRTPRGAELTRADQGESVQQDVMRSGARSKDRRHGMGGSLAPRPALLACVDAVPWPDIAEPATATEASPQLGAKRARSLTSSNRLLSSPVLPSSGERKRSIRTKEKKDKEVERAATRSKVKAKTKAAAPSSSSISSSRQILAATLAAVQAKLPPQSAEWTKGEVIALYHCHAQTSINQPNFWEEVANKMSTRSYQRTAEECEHRFYKVLEDRKHRRGKSIDEKRRERVQEVQAKLAKMAARSGPKWKGSTKKGEGGGERQEEEEEEEGEEEEEEGNGSEVEDTSAGHKRKAAPVKEVSRPRLTKQDLQVLSQEASKAKKEDDLFDRHPLQRTLALPANVAVPTTPIDNKEPMPPRAVSLEASPPRLFQSQRVHDLKRRIQPTLLVAYDSHTLASKLQPSAGGGAGLGKKTSATLAALQGGLGGGASSIRQKNRAVMGLLQRNLDQELKKLPRGRGDEDEDDEEEDLGTGEDSEEDEEIFR